MKKFLGLFAITGLIASTSTMAISCEEKNPNIVKIYDYNGKLVEKVDKTTIKGWYIFGIQSSNSSYLVIRFKNAEEDSFKEYGELAGQVDWWNTYLFKLIWDIDLEL